MMNRVKTAICIVCSLVLMAGASIGLTACKKDSKTTTSKKNSYDVTASMTPEQ